MQNLEKKRSDKSIKFLRSILAVLSLVLIASSCNPTKYIPEGDTLLDNNHISVNEDDIKKSDLVPYIRQKPNKKIFGARFHLGLYNLSDINKEKWPHSWLRNIGEEPVIYDPYATNQSQEQLGSYIASKGYFDGLVTDTVITQKRKSNVYYNVDLKSPYTIRNLIYEIDDTTIRKLFYFDSVNCMIERGMPYDVDILQAERSRLERSVKDRGFYGFSGEHIFFNIDSTIGNRKVDVYYGIKNPLIYDQYNRPVYVPHSIYSIRNIYIYPDFVPREVLRGGESYVSSLDTVNYKGFYFISSNGKPELKYDLILQSLYIRPGAPYNITNTEQSQSHLLALKAYRLVNIYYSEAEKDAGGDMMLDCHIQLTLLSQQSFRVDLEGTNSAGNLGGALNLTYQHKNLFKGAEQFSLKLKGAYEALAQNNIRLRSSQEYGIETSLRLPKFLMPVLKKEEFIRNYNPTTTLLAAYNYMDMPLYRRTMANLTFGYTWNAGAYKTHIVNPAQMNLVKLLYIDTAFLERYSSSYVAYSYRDVLILGGNYSFIFNNQSIKKSRDYWFIRVNAELSGNMLGLASKISGASKSDGSYHVFGQPFAQYLRADIDLRYNYILNDVSSVVYRGFIGAGIPYGNSKAIPFEKQYFGGGANGIRAWQVRSLGPGTFASNDTSYFNQTADIKLEFNTEYRFNLFWILEGALFLDAGNIWSYNDDPTGPVPSST